MKKILILGALSIFIMPFAMSTYIYASVERGDNDCMKKYVNDIKNEGYNGGAFYKTPGSYHIDIYDFTEYEKIADVKGCKFENIKDGYFIYAKFNEIYCKTSYFLTDKKGE